MRKTALLMVFALAASLLSIHLPWIYDAAVDLPSVEELVVDEKIEYSYWSFMAKKTIYSYSPSEDYRWSQTIYLMFNDFWGDPPGIWSLLHLGIGVGRPLSHLWEGYYVLFLFQLLAVLFMFACIVAEKWDAPLHQIILYIATFFVSLGAPIVGINQYTQDWGFDGGVTIGHTGGRSLVQFEIGFYLALVSSILILIYILSTIIGILREKSDSNRGDN